MGRAEDLYEKLTSEGEAAIDQMILDRESETFFLDFKQEDPKHQELYDNEHF